MSPSAAKSPKTKVRAAPHIAGERPHLRILGTEITLLDEIREQAEKDLGISITFEMLDFLSAQRKAATQPAAYDIYDQCFHSLDIVWYWQGIQAIDTQRIELWDEVSDLTKVGRINAHARAGRGDAPVKSLYVQPSQSLGPRPSRYISMLPTVYNVNSFTYDPGALAKFNGDEVTWAWLFDPRLKGRIALIDEPAIGIFDAALAVQAMGEIRFADIGNMTVAEIDQLIDFLLARKREGYFSGIWRTVDNSVALFASERTAIQSMWSPGTNAVRRLQKAIEEAVPKEGYRAWHGGLSLSRNLSGRNLDAAYDYLNWWLSGWPGAVMARQGYYLSVPKRVKDALAPDEWNYWYEGLPAARDLPGTNGRTTIQRGWVRSGGAYWERASHIAVWNTTMDEHNYLVRRWSQFLNA